MKSIEQFSFISNADGTVFANRVKANIDSMQEMGLEVEIQYSTSSEKKSVVYSAILLGKKEVK